MAYPVSKYTTHKRTDELADVFASSATDAKQESHVAKRGTAQSEGTQNPLSAVRPKLISIDQVCDMLALKKSAVHAKVATRELPAPVKFGRTRRSAARWLEHEIVAFILEKAAARPLQPGVNQGEG